MSKIILKVGYREILLPDDTGLAAVMKTLSRGIEIDSDRSYDHANPRIVLRENTPQIEIKYVPNKTKFSVREEATGKEIEVGVKQLTAQKALRA
jgi:hypothetical protein